MRRSSRDNGLYARLAALQFATGAATSRCADDPPINADHFVPNLRVTHWPASFAHGLSVHRVRPRVRGLARDAATGVEVRRTPVPLPRGCRRSRRTQAFFRSQDDGGARAQLDAIPGRAALLARIRASRAPQVTVRTLAMAVRRLLPQARAGPADPGAVRARGLRRRRARAARSRPRRRRARRAPPSTGIAPSPDGRHVAYGVSPGGTEDSVLRVLEADSGARPAACEIDRARFNRDLAWHPDGRSFYYARIPRRAARPAHALREPPHLPPRPGRDAARRTRSSSPPAWRRARRARDRRTRPCWCRSNRATPTRSCARACAARSRAREPSSATSPPGKPRWRKLVGVEDEVTRHRGAGATSSTCSRTRARRAHRVLAREGTASRVSPAARGGARGRGGASWPWRSPRDALYLRSTVGGVDRLERVPIGLLGA